MPGQRAVRPRLATGKFVLSFYREQKIIANVPALVVLQNRVSNFRGLYGRLHMMRAHNVCSLQNQSRFARDRSEQAFVRSSILPAGPKRPSDEGFPRGPHEQRKSNSMQFAEVRDERIVLVETFPESEARIENKALPPNS